MNVVKCGAFLTMLYRLMPESLVAVLAISALDTAVTTLIIGPPLRVFTFSRIEAEADLRAALMRAQQYAEEIVLFRGGDRELARCQRQLDGILGIQRSRRDCPAASPAARRAAGARASARAGSLCRNNAQSSSGCSASSPAGRRRRRRPSLAGPCCPSKVQRQGHHPRFTASFYRRPDFRSVPLGVPKHDARPHVPPGAVRGERRGGHQGQGRGAKEFPAARFPRRAQPLPEGCPTRPLALSTHEPRGDGPPSPSLRERESAAAAAGSPHLCRRPRFQSLETAQAFFVAKELFKGKQAHKDVKKVRETFVKKAGEPAASGAAAPGPEELAADLRRKARRLQKKFKKGGPKPDAIRT